MRKVDSARVELRSAIELHEAAKREKDHEMVKILYRDARKRYERARSAFKAASRSAWTAECDAMIEMLKLKPEDEELISAVEGLIVRTSPAVSWNEIAGFSNAKATLQQMVILPMKRSDLFKGLRSPPRGLLLFGPPGNGKTMLAKALVSESGATFFNVSASSLTSKWHGESEKLVRTLFAFAALKEPSIIFIDEIDSLMSTRSTNEHEASRRLKTEFLVQFDGLVSRNDARITVIGATNRPEDLDNALIRRLVKRVYVPLPDAATRRLLLKNVLAREGHLMSNSDLEKVVVETDGYSCSDLTAFCKLAVSIPVYEATSRIMAVREDELRRVGYSDFRASLQTIRPSVAKSDIRRFEVWDEKFGSRPYSPIDVAAPATPSASQLAPAASQHAPSASQLVPRWKSMFSVFSI